MNPIVTQGKTKTRLWIPFTERLAHVFQANTRTSLKFILADGRGRQLNYDQLQKKVLAIRKASGLEAYTLHGLRYRASGELAEAGRTDHQIAAITGHNILSMVQKYSKSANQMKLAKEDQRLREQNKNRS